MNMFDLNTALPKDNIKNSSSICQQIVKCFQKCPSPHLKGALIYKEFYSTAAWHTVGANN